MAVANRAGHVLNFNTANREELQSLPGVGPVRADLMMAYRTEVGMVTENQFMEKFGKELWATDLVMNNIMIFDQNVPDEFGFERNEEVKEEGTMAEEF